MIEPHFCEHGLLCRQVTRLGFGIHGGAKGAKAGFNMNAPIAQCIRNPHQQSQQPQHGMYQI